MYIYTLFLNHIYSLLRSLELRIANPNCSSSVGMNPQPEEPREEHHQPVYITIKIWTQDGDEFLGWIRRDSKLSKFFAAHRRSKPLDSLATYEYLVDGHRVRPSQTAEQLGLEDGSQIDAMIHQSGGSGWVANSV